MSLNSLESKTSPHSWHSTNSASSSRATTRTRGCRQSFCISVVLEDCFSGEIWTGFIFGFRRFLTGACHELRVFYPHCEGCQVFPHPRRKLLSLPVAMDEDSYSRVAEILKATDKYLLRARLGLVFA